MSAWPLLRADLHTHTHFSHDSIASPQSLVEACRRKGINCLAVTDHNSIQGGLAALELADGDPIVIVGEEVRTAAGEVIGLFLSEEVPSGLSPDETVERIEAQGGVAGVPHPYDRLRLGLRHEEMVRLLPHISFIEALNARIIFPADNGRARRFAQGNGLAMSAGTDAHHPMEIGRCYVEMRPFQGPEDFLAALREGKLVGGLASPLVHLLSRYAVLRRRLGWRPR